jgi:hypothetical protein
MKAHRFSITVAAVASLAVAIGAAAGSTDTTPPWLDALNARSEALNEKYRLGDHSIRRTLGAPGPGWREALQARSDAMNRYYGLGEHARQSARHTSTPDWLAALNTRSEALNREYGLGDSSLRSAQATGGSEVIRFLSVRVSQKQPNDKTFIFRNKDMINGKKVGHDILTCTAISQTKASCSIVFAFAAGKLNAKFGLLFAASSGTGVISGGTGEYAGARGTLTFKNLDAEGTRTRVVVTLT